MTERISELLNMLRDESNCNVLDYVDEAADLIETLAAELERVKRERDAAVADLKGLCDVCAHFETCDGPWCGDCDSFDGCESPCKTCPAESNWQWRGAKED